MAEAIIDGIRATIAHLAIPMDSLKEHPANPNHGDVAAIVESLRFHGQYAPVVFNTRPGTQSERCLIKGNHTYQAMRQLGRTTIAALPVDVDDEQAIRILIADNRLSDLHTTDDEALAAMLTDLGDLTGTGYTQEALDALVASTALAVGSPVEDVEPELDRAEELRVQYGVELGQLWHLGRHRLLCGDSTDAACVAQLMGSDTARMAWFDPPFGIDLHPQRQLNAPIANDGNTDARAIWAAFLPLLHQTLTDPGVAFLCQGWTEFPWTLPLVGLHFTIKSKIVWHKTQWGIGYYTRPQHEDILYCWKGTPERPADAISDVWDVARAAAPDHAAEKPAALSRIAIEFASTSGDIVIDWFAGVGGSIVACEQLQRRCYAIELDPGYVAVAIHRWEQATGQKAERHERVSAGV